MPKLADIPDIDMRDAAPPAQPALDMDEVTLAKLAREMAMCVRKAEAIFADYGIDETQYYELATRNEFFKRAKEQFTLEWNSSCSAADRVRAISAAYLEQSLPALAKRLQGNEPLAAVADMAKLFARNAGIGDLKGDAKSNERFVITINMGDDATETYNKSIEIKPDDVNLKMPKKIGRPRKTAAGGGAP
jgi:hypothetical protein